ncbi:hypothetical protein AHIS1636_38010 [Arthrobacter mangrovi]|uniref:Uncharacterized protein n=1 Tax=Arthrobacter mangrovi TaxID=2966350 RepID=A0ABQ5MZP3_9MICC|nr:hypothetical protein AHIS1636_38010 [Arthrobacter mangrovi]
MRLGSEPGPAALPGAGGVPFPSGFLSCSLMGKLAFLIPGPTMRENVFSLDFSQTTGADAVPPPRAAVRAVPRAVRKRVYTGLRGGPLAAARQENMYPIGTTELIKYSGASLAA